MWDYPTPEQCALSGEWFLVFRAGEEAYRVEGPYQTEADARKDAFVIAWQEAYTYTGTA